MTDSLPLHNLITSLSVHLPPVMRWAGAVARRLRQFNIALESKHSGSALTDALTLADLTVQELLVAAIRDSDPLFCRCRLLAEESTGDLARFAQESPYTIALDPIDGTKQYRDHTGTGYSIIITLQSRETVHFSLVFIPEEGPHGSWVRVVGDEVSVGPDDPARPAGDVISSLPVRSTAPTVAGEPQIYLIGFQDQDPARAAQVTGLGMRGVFQDEMPGCVYSLLARGEFAGSLIHTPNIYDFPVSLQLVRAWGGDSVWAHNRQPVNFSETWMDERASMLRLPGIVATSPDRQILDKLCTLAQNWNPIRYAE